MDDDSILVIKGPEVSELLKGQEFEILRRCGWPMKRMHVAKPLCLIRLFSVFRQTTETRVLALRAYLGDSFDVAGIKWIASFPNNIRQHKNRASAVIILNSTETGRPQAIIEGWSGYSRSCRQQSRV